MVLEGSFEQLRKCGARRAECVVYWCASLNQPDLLIGVVHPEHHARYGGYQVDSAWVNQFFLDLRRTRQTVRAQVHTHPGTAGHSEIDDHFSLAPADGFLSLVIPYFATGQATLSGAALVQMQPDGSWAQLSPEEVICVE